MPESPKRFAAWWEVEALFRRVTVEQLSIDEDEYSPSASFTEDFGADSLDIIELTLELERTFGQEVDDDVVGSMSTVGDALTYLADHVVLDSHLGPVPPVLAFRVREDGSIAVQMQATDGSWIYADGTSRLPSGLYVASFAGFADALRKLQDLINSPGVSENELQQFFEHHPELLKGAEYSVVIPQAIVSSEENLHWRADFVLKPFDELEFCKILELKLPQMPISRGSRSGHAQFYADLLSAISQLRDYGEAFNSERSRSSFKDKYGVEVYKPELQLIAGRRWELTHSRRLLELQRRNGVYITDWDSHLEKLKRRFGAVL